MEAKITSARDPLAPANLVDTFLALPTIETSRLLLRPLRRTDVQDIFDYGSDPEVAKYMIWPRHTSLADAHSFLDLCDKAIALQERIPLAIHSKEYDKLIGACQFHHISPEHQRAEVGYVLARRYWGKGYMTEALNGLIEFAFTTLGLHRLEANCDDQNIRSYRVMERCGMQFEGTAVDYEIRNSRRVSLRMYAVVNRKSA